MVDGSADVPDTRSLAGACAGGRSAVKLGSPQDRGRKRRRPDGREHDEGPKLRRQTGGGILRYFRRVGGPRPSQPRPCDPKSCAGSSDAALSAAPPEAPEAPLAAVATTPSASAPCPATALEPPESSPAAEGENTGIHQAPEEPTTDDDELLGPTQMWGRVSEATPAISTQAEPYRQGATPLDAAIPLDATVPLTHSPLPPPPPEGAPVPELAEIATHEPFEADVCDSQGFPGPTQMWGRPLECEAAPPCWSPPPRRVPTADTLEPISPTLTFHPQEPEALLVSPSVACG